MTTEILQRIEKLALSNENIKKVKNEVPWNRNYEIVDYSLKPYGFKEDQTYLEDEEIWRVIRRGTSIIKVYGNDDSLQDISIARLGLPKSYDLHTQNVELLGQNPDQLSVFPKIGKLNPKYSKIAHKRLLTSIEELLSSGESQLSITRTKKSNGENLQVSYSEICNCWVLGSKNVSMLVREESDLSLYSKSPRYRFTKKIGQLWFETISELTSDELESLKKDLNGFTLVGEYIGSYDHQQIIKYKKEEIKFFACVDHAKMDPCEPPEEAFDFLDYYHLPCWEYKKREGIDSIETLKEILFSLLKEIKSKTVEESHEGEVIYFQDGNKVVSIAKIRSLEFSIFSKLRDKIKSMVHKKKRFTKKELISAINFEIEQLVTEPELLQRPLDEYLDLIEMGLNFADELKDPAAYTIDYFASFISVLLFSYYKGEKLSIELFENTEKLYKIEDTSWDEYIGSEPLGKVRRSPEKEKYTQKDQKPDSEESEPQHEEEKAVASPQPKRTQGRQASEHKSSRKSPQKLKTPAKAQPQIQTSPKKPLMEISNKKPKKQQKDDKNYIRNLSVVMNVSAPGTGAEKFYKSFLQRLEQRKSDFKILHSVVDSEKIFEEMQKKYNGEGPLEAAFLQKYEQDVYNIISEGIQASCDQFVLFISHKYQLGSISEEIEKIKSWLPDNLFYKFFYVANSNKAYSEPLELSSSDNEPSTLDFSSYCVLSGIQRILTDEIDATASAEAVLGAFSPQQLASLVEFLNYVLESSIEETGASYYKKLGFDHFIGFPFYSVIGEKVFELREDKEELIDLLREVLEELRFGAATQLLKSENLGNLIKKIKKIKFDHELWNIEYRESEVGSKFGADSNSTNKNTQNTLSTYYDYLIDKSVTTLIKRTYRRMKYQKIRREQVLRARELALKEEANSKLQNVEKQVREPRQKKKYSYPDYMAYVALEPTFDRVKKAVLNMITLISSKSPKNKVIRADVHDLMNPKPRNWKIPQIHNLTALFLKRKPPKKKIEKEVFSKFEDGQNFKISVKAFAYIPGHIVTGITELDRSLHPCTSQFDHLTLMNSGFGMRMSNDILEELFVPGSSYRDFYDEGFENLMNIVETTVGLDGSNYQVFLIPLVADDYLEFDVVSQSVY